MVMTMTIIIAATTTIIKAAAMPMSILKMCAMAKKKRNKTWHQARAQATTHRLNTFNLQQNSLKLSLTKAFSNYCLPTTTQIAMSPKITFLHLVASQKTRKTQKIRLQFKTKKKPRSSSKRIALIIKPQKSRIIQSSDKKKLFSSNQNRYCNRNQNRYCSRN